MTSFYRKYGKRIFDLCVTIPAFVVLSPVMGVTAVLVAGKLGRPVLFTQDRPGKDQKIFKMYKFRTMLDSHGPSGELLPDKERLTSFGKKLRATSLDELPELFNILKGDMSIIGPRPLLVKYLPYYTEEENVRHQVWPGLTGLAQIHGRNTCIWEERFRYDREYVEHLSFGLDCKIVWLTIQKVFKASDIVEPGVLEDFDEYRKKQYENANL